MIIIGMAANPEPDKLILVQYAYSTIIAADPNRIEWSTRMNLLKMQTSMLRVLPEQKVRLLCLAANAFG
jgi:hypothetical protein